MCSHQHWLILIAHSPKDTRIGQTGADLQSLLQANLRGSLLAQDVAAAFNDPARRGGTLAAGTIHFPETGSIVVVPDAETLGGQAAYLLEPYIEHANRWHKWINNDGSWENTGEMVPEVLSAFCHFSLVHVFERDGSALMILDIQVSLGIRLENAS